MAVALGSRERTADQQKLKDFAKGAVRRLPPQTLLQLKRAYASVKTRPARRAFESASTRPAWLDEPELDRLQKLYPPVPKYGYDPDSLEKRGRGRAKILKRLLTSPHAPPQAIELGCGDGMVSAMLARAGADVSAVDLSSEKFDARAEQAGVRFLEADVSRLPFQDSRFDLVFSFNAFEHFPDPGLALPEAIRVTKPGGLIFLSFGPLYMSAFGPHSALSLNVPYSHYLFPRNVLDAYVERNNLRPIPHETTNKWSLPQYRELWDRHAAELERLMYREIPEVHGIELVLRYPQCFRSKTTLFENLIVGTIEAAFRKKA